jgi:hypothetical protein
MQRKVWILNFELVEAQVRGKFRATQGDKQTQSTLRHVISERADLYHISLSLYHYMT